jgi:hypothetical protein
MAAPTPSDFVTTDITTAATSFTINIPTSAVAGDRVFVAFGYAVTGNTISLNGAPTGLVVEKQIEMAAGGTNGLYCLVYEVQGSETTITLDATSSTKAGAVACRIQGDEDPGTQAPEFSTGATGSNGPPDPDAVTPTGGSKDYLFIIAGSMGGEIALTAADADYSNFTEADSGTGGAVTSNSRTAIATRQLTAAASDDPDAFTGGDSTGEWAAMTIAFHPVGATPDNRAEVSQFEFEIPGAQNRAEVSQFEFEIPTPDNRAEVSQFELELPTPDNRAEVSQFELEIPNPPAPDNRAEVSQFEFEIPLVSNRAEVSQFELELPTPDNRAEVSQFEFEIPSPDNRAEVSQFELEIPALDNRAEVSQFELEIPDAGGSVTYYVGLLIHRLYRKGK